MEQAVRPEPKRILGWKHPVEIAPRPVRTVSSRNTVAPLRAFMIGLLPSGTNLLSEVLELEQQPNIITVDALFRDSFLACCVNSAVVNGNLHWSPTVKAEVSDSINRDLRRAEESTLRARPQQNNPTTTTTTAHPTTTMNPTGNNTTTNSNKTTLCASICAPWLINPAVFNKDAPQMVAMNWEFFKAATPPTYMSPTVGFTWDWRNQTILPDQYLRTWQLTFVITHPVILFPKIYRALHAETNMPQAHRQGVAGLYMTYTWHRTLYDWARRRAMYRPVIVETGQLSEEPGQTIFKYYYITGLPVKGGVIPRREILEFKERHRAAHGAVVDAVRGVMGRRARSFLDAWIEVEKGCWEAEFGEAAANFIERFVREAMADYEYLYALK
ncbi:hypothetical protein BJX64DRAFT_289032 [Aspergillus heterothallicus]